MEYFDIVNEQDIIVGKASREECHKNPELIHRATNVFIFNSEKLDHIMRIKRTSAVDTEHGKWTILVGEHNTLEETYEHSIRRGLREELGIKKIDCKEISYVLIKMKYQSEYHKNYIAVYKDDIKNLKLCEEEIEKVEFIRVSDLLEDIKINKENYVSYIENALETITSFISK